MAILLLRGLTHVNATLARISVSALVLLLIGMTVVMGMSVYFRYVVNDSLSWSEEAIRYSAIWLVFLGIGVAHRWGQHVRISLLASRLNGQKRIIFETSLELIMLVLCSIITWIGFQSFMALVDRGQSSLALGIPMSWIYLSVPLGFLLASLQSLERLLWLIHELIEREPAPPIPYGEMPEDELATEESDYA